MAASDQGKLRLIRGTGAPDGSGSRAEAPLSDRQLVDAARAGDEGVATALCARVAPQIDRTIRRLVGRSDSDHDDLAQICLIEIVNTIERYRGDCSLDRWVQTVTAHVVFKHLRRRKLERRIFTELLADDGHPGPFHLDREAITRGLLARVATHLDHVASARAWAFLLHDGLGYDLTEAAEMLGCSVAAAQSRLSRGRRDLHQRIAGDPELRELLRREEAAE